MKRLGLILALACILTLPAVGAAHADVGDCDLNGDGVISAADAAVYLRQEHSDGDYPGGMEILLKSVGSLPYDSVIPGEPETDILSPDHLFRFSYSGSVNTDTSYIDDSISIKITTKRAYKSKCFIADIYVRKIDSLRTAFSSGKYQGKQRDVLVMAKENNALLAISGDYYMKNARGSVVRNGEIYNEKKSGTLSKSRDILVLYRDGTMEVFSKGTLSFEDIASNEEILHLWVFGPDLLDQNGNPKASFNAGESILPKHPRCCLGYYEPGHYCFVLVDGRTEEYSRGMTMPELSDFMSTLGCKMAYNLDGGKTACMVFRNQLINRPAGGGRPCSDIVYICLPDTGEETSEEG